jgi:hypothetical protein
LIQDDLFLLFLRKITLLAVLLNDKPSRKYKCNL